MSSSVMGVVARFRGRQVLVAVVVVVGVCGACGSHGQKGAGSAGSSPASSVAAGSSAAQTLLKAGISQADAKMVSQAASTFPNVLVLDPKNYFALYNLGLVDQEEHRNSEAVKYYNEALAVDPKYTPAMYNKAIVVEGTDLKGALALYQQIVAINSKASTAFLRMAFIYAKEGQVAQANQARKNAIALDPGLAKYPLPARCATPSKPNC